MTSTRVESAQTVKHLETSVHLVLFLHLEAKGHMALLFISPPSTPPPWLCDTKYMCITQCPPRTHESYRKTSPSLLNLSHCFAWFPIKEGSEGMRFSGSLLVIFQIGMPFELFLEYIMSCSLSLRLSTSLLFLWHWEWNAEPSYMPGLLVSFHQLGINQSHLGRGKVSWGTVCIRLACGPVSRVFLNC